MIFFRRLMNEHGVALPVAMAVMAAVAGLATVAARAAIVSNNQSFRDNNAKRAVQAANAGLQTALYQTNLMQPLATQCVRKDASTGALSNGALQADTWCQAQTEDLGDGATYTMQVSSPTIVTTSTGLSVDQRKVVSYGTVNGVRRRAVVTINASRGNPLFPPGFALTVRDSITLMNNATFNGHVGSNGSIELKNNSTACGDIVTGPGYTPVLGRNSTQCPGYNKYTASEPFDLQPVDVSLATPNDNQRLTNMKASPPIDPRDTCSNCNKVSWSNATRVLTVDGPGVLTLTGNTYRLCRLEVKTGATIQIVSRSTPLRIYIDSPNDPSCGGTSGMGSVIWNGNLVNLYSPPHALAILVAGSPTKSTLVDLPSNDASSPMAIYAPNSAVQLKNNIDFTGALVAKSVTAMNNAKFTWHPSVNGLTSGSDIRFYRTATGSYKECTGTPTSSVPDSGC
jgi:Tfp pilus assembly protein PilX